MPSPPLELASFIFRCIRLMGSAGVSGGDEKDGNRFVRIPQLHFQLKKGPLRHRQNKAGQSPIPSVNG